MKKGVTMRIKISFVFIIMLSLLSLQAVFVEIGDGTFEQSVIPANGFYDYGWSKTIYLQSDLGDSHELTGISYQVSNTPDNYEFVNQKIYMKHTADSIMTDPVFNDPSVDTSYSLVFTGNVIVDGTGWFNIVFNSSFNYNGMDNLEVFYINDDGEYDGGEPDFMSTMTEDYRALFQYADVSFPYYNGSLSSYFPNTRFYYPAGNEPAPATLVYPEDNASGLPIVVDLEWSMNANTNYVDVYLSTDYLSVESLDASVMVLEQNSSGLFTTDELENLSVYYWCVVSRNNTTDYEVSSLIRTFTTGGQTGSIEIGSGNVVNQSLPCELYYGYSVSQTIYLQEWLNVENQTIEEISYHYNGNQAFTEDNVTIWIGHTDLTSFESGDSWQSVDDLVMVYDGPMTVEAVDSWITFQFIIPFNYNNTQNIVVGFEQNTVGYHSSNAEFFCTEVDGNLSIEKYQDSADYDFVNPPTGTLRPYIPNTIFTLCDTPTEPQLMVTPDAYDWSDTIISTLGEEKTFVIRNVGLGTLTINSVSLDQNVDFVLNDTNNYPIDINTDPIELTVTFAPQSEDNFTANIVFTDSQNNVTNIPLTGFGYNATITEFPYFQSFDSDPVNTLPQDWASIVESTSIYATVGITSSFAYEGAQCVKFFTSSDGDASLNLISPPVLDITEKRVRFMMHSTHEGTNMIVGTYDGQGITSIFTPIDTILVPITYTQHVVCFDEYAGTDGMIGFKYVENNGTYVNVVIDNLFIEDVPTGPALTITADTLDFGEIFLNREGLDFFTISNWGLDNLVGTISCDNPYFTFESNDYEVAPNETHLVEVGFIPQEEGAFLGSFTVTSNDPNLPELTLYGEAFVLPPLSNDLAIIGNGELTGQHMPIEPFYGYTYSQVIYYAGEIGIDGQQIEKISWYYNGNSAWTGDALKIYLGHTDLNEFEDNTSWIDISELMPVFDGILDVTTEAGWIEFELDIPFVYDNSSNLVVAVEENTQGYHSSNDEFLATASNVTRGIVHYSDGVNADPVNPPNANYMMNSFANLKLEFGDIPDEPALVVLPGDITFEMTPVGGQSEARVINLRSIGLQDIVIATTPLKYQ